MFGRQEDVFSDQSKELRKEYKEELKREKEEKNKHQRQADPAKEAAQAELERDRRIRESLIAKENFSDEPTYDFDEVVKVSDVINPKHQSEKKPDESEKEKITPGKVIKNILLVLLIIFGGFLAAWIAAFLNKSPFSPLGQWELIVSMDVFCLTSTAFFMSHGKLEKAYAFFSILSFACFVMQLIITFR